MVKMALKKALHAILYNSLTAGVFGVGDQKVFTETQLHRSDVLSRTFRQRQQHIPASAFVQHVSRVERWHLAALVQALFPQHE
jgi:hypothetical protein